MRRKPVIVVGVEDTSDAELLVQLQRPIPHPSSADRAAVAAAIAYLKSRNIPTPRLVADGQVDPDQYLMPLPPEFTGVE